MGDKILQIADIANLRMLTAAIPANPGSLAIENINGVFYKVDDQGNITSLDAADSIRPGVQLAIVRSPLIDYTVAATTNSVIPAKAGFYWLGFGNPRHIITQQSGTLTTQPTIKIGNNGTNDNLMNASTIVPSTAQFNASTPAPQGDNLNAPTAGGAQLVDLATPMALVVTIGATGTSLVYKGYVYFHGFYIPTTDIP